MSNVCQNCFNAQTNEKLQSLEEDFNILNQKLEGLITRVDNCQAMNKLRIECLAKRFTKLEENSVTKEDHKSDTDYIIQVLIPEQQYWNQYKPNEQ